jgi:tetratricopeptide (TPR) repeat protein
MHTTSVTRTGDPKRPMFVRVARKWYSWAGLTLAFTAAYLAFDGQLRLGFNQLQAAPPLNDPPEPDPAWTAAPAETTKCCASAESDKDVKPVAAETDAGPQAPQPSRPRFKDTVVGKVLDAYLNGDVVQANHEEAQGQDGPKIVIPPPDEKTPAKEPKAPVADPVEIIEPKAVSPDSKKAAPNIPLPLPPKKVEVPGLVAPDEQANDAKVDKKEAQPLDKSIVEPELIPTLPAPEIAREPDLNNKAMAAEIESLKPNERLLYDGALVETKLKNYPVAIDRYEQLLRLRPDLLYVRAEFAGILITAAEMRKAVEQYQRLVERAPRNIGFRIRLGDAFIINRQYREAIMHFTEALRIAPNEPEYAVRLARAYAFDNDFTRATQVYERYLANLRPEDPKTPVALGALLLDLERPSEALPYLLAKRRLLEKTPKDPLISEVLASLVRGYARIGERGLAMEVLNDMSARFPEQAGVRIVLGNTLVQIDEFELAGQVYNQVLQSDSANGAALVGLARVHLEMFYPANARRILDSFIPNAANQRVYLLTYAAYHEKIGEYIEAKQIYRDMLRRNPNDHEVRYALGALLEYVKEWEKAKGEFAKIPPTGALGKRARLYFAQALFSQRKYLEAAEVASVLIAEDPNDANAIAAATKYLGKAGKYPQAFELARGYLSTNPKSEQQALVVRLALARALLDSARYLEAQREYEIAMSKPSGRIVVAFYGLARACEKLGNPQRAVQMIGCITGLPGGDVRNRMLLADQYQADFDDQHIVELCMSVLHGDPENLIVLIRLVDAQQRLSRYPGNPADCFTTCLTILKLSPTNVRGHLAMARSFAVAQNYRKASAEYDNLIRIDPEFTIPPRERARVLFSDHQFSAARSQYNAMLQISPDDVAMAELSAVVQRDSKMRAMFAPYVLGKVTGPVLRQEMQRLAGAPDEDVRLAAQRVVADYDATIAWQKAFVLERDAKELKDVRAFQAVPAYEAANAFEPTNTETLFDLGQNDGGRFWTRKAMDWYSAVLQVDPTHRDAAVASERADAEMGPKLDASENYFYQRGRNGLASIDRNRWTVDGRVPLGDENEYFMLGYSRATYSPTNGDPTADGNIPFIRAQKRFCDDRILAYGQLNIEEYTNGFRTRPTFDVGAYYYCCDWLTTRAGGYLENVAENGESIRQDIYRGGFYLGADFKPTRTWAFGGEYRYARYSDDNDMNQLTLYNENSLTLPPKQLKIVEKLYLLGYREQTIYPTNPPDPNDITGAIHPYFSPSGFAQMEVRVEWWHWLSRDYFVHSNQCYYSLQYGIATDNNLVTYHNLRALVNYDVCTWLTIGGEADAQLSSVYNMFSAMGFLQIRFR